METPIKEGELPKPTAEVVFQQAVKDVNDHFKLKGRNKIILPFKEDGDNDPKECLILFNLYVVKNLIPILLDKKGSLLLVDLTKKMDTTDIRYVAKEKEIFGSSQTLLLMYCINSIHQPVELRRPSLFYLVRTSLLDCLKIVLYCREGFLGGNCPLYYLKKLQKQYGKNVRVLLASLAEAPFFNVGKEIYYEHQKWMETVAQFYLNEYQILRHGFDSLEEHRKKGVKSRSIVLHTNEDPSSKLIAHSLGIINESFNMAYSTILKKPFLRPKFGHESAHLIELSTFLMENMIEFSQSDTIPFSRITKFEREETPRGMSYQLLELEFLQRIAHDQERFTFINVSKFPEGERIKQLFGVLADMSKIMLNPKEFVLMTTLSKEQKEFLEKNSDMYLFDQRCLQMLDSIKELMEKLIVFRKSHQAEVEKSVSKILDLLPVFRKAFFNNAFEFCSQLTSIFFFSRSTRKYIKVFIKTDLSPLMEKQKKM